jgi:homopolymeric O-antigen transport system ATP-binding protein
LISVVIRVESIGKRYRVGAEAGGLLRDKLAGALRDPVGLLRRRKRETFWALKDISFEVKEGEVLGLIGRNGAGKSTLLKVLARITKPTQGHAEIHGRVGSLLEVGTGFHPELTGRENVFLNGAILGMGRQEITRKFDEIVAFAEVEKFIDTPVKHYSSGMYVRLAFAVAAHLETEILFVDEVLSVGDIAFQKKCLGKMDEVAHQGRTVIFVSHNMGPVRTLCKTGILLRNGGIVRSGSIEDVIGAYIDGSSEAGNSPTVRLPKPPQRCSVWMESVSVLRDGEATSVFHFGDRISLGMKFRASTPIEKPIVGYLIRSSRGENVVNANNYFLPSGRYPEPVMEGTIVCDLGDVPLMAGSYSVSFWLCRNPLEQHHVDDVLHFTVEDKDIWGSGALPNRSFSGLWWPTEFAFSARLEPVTVPGDDGRPLAGR